MGTVLADAGFDVVRVAGRERGAGIPAARSRPAPQTSSSASIFFSWWRAIARFARLLSRTR
jgi:hypothetical protein